MRRRVPTFVLLLGVESAVALPSSGQAPDARGEAIARESQQRQSGFGDFQVSLRMTLTDGSGRTRVRDMQIRVLEIAGDGDRSLVVLERPGDLAGTALLTHAHAGAADDQWLYIPALGRVRRLSTGDRTGAFLGSEFSYEDIAAQQPEQYRHRWIREAEEEGRTVDVVERVPRAAGSAYARQEVSFDRETRRPSRIAYFAPDGTLLKTLGFGDYREYQGRFWRAHAMLMENRRTGAATRLAWSTYRFHTGLSREEFESRTLGRR